MSLLSLDASKIDFSWVIMEGSFAAAESSSDSMEMSCTFGRDNAKSQDALLGEMD